MIKYTIDELFQLKPSVTLEVNFDAVEFRAIIEKVKQLQHLKEEEFNSHHVGHFGRRRSSHHHGRPKIKHNKPKVTTDSDGWCTFEAKKKGSGEDDEEETETTPTSTVPVATIAQETLKVKPNNKKYFFQQTC